MVADAEICTRKFINDMAVKLYWSQPVLNIIFNKVVIKPFMQAFSIILVSTGGRTYIGL